MKTSRTSRAYDTFSGSHAHYEPEYNHAHYEPEYEPAANAYMPPPYVAARMQSGRMSEDPALLPKLRNEMQASGHFLNSRGCKSGEADVDEIGARRPRRPFRLNTDPDPAEPSRNETFILQCMVSGVLVVFAALIGMAQFDAAEGLRNGLRSALSGAETPAELFEDVRGLFPDAPAYVPETPEADEPLLLLPEAPLTTEYESPPQIPGSSEMPELR